MIENFSKKSTTMPKAMLIGVGTYLPEVMVHLEQSESISSGNEKAR